MLSEIKSQMLSRIGYATTKIARKLLLKNKGDKLETIRQLSEKLDVGRGTVQSALDFLKQNNVIEVESRGHLGTYLKDLNYKLLWEIADVGMIMGVMPLPYSLKYEGLATAFNKQFQELNIPFNMAFIRGARNRINVLNNQYYDFVIASRFAAKQIVKKNEQLKLLYDFGQNSYLSKHVIVFAENNNEIEDGMKIGIDKYSIDHKYLTELECEDKEVEYIELTYLQILQHIHSKRIDAAIWNYDEIVNQEEKFKFVPLQKPESVKMNNEISRAAVIINKNNEIIENILSNNIKHDDMLEIQNSVIEHEIIPEY